MNRIVVKAFMATTKAPNEAPLTTPRIWTTANHATAKIFMAIIHGKPAMVAIGFVIVILVMASSKVSLFSAPSIKRLTGRLDMH